MKLVMKCFSFGFVPVLVLVLGISAGGGQAKTNPPANPQAANTVSKVAPWELPAPQAIFTLPHKPDEGKDPFYPKSQRPYSTTGPVVVTNAQPVAVQVDLKLKVLSGPPDHRLATINNHAFEAGEEAEVISGDRRIRIRCVEIKADSVVVQVGNERKELKMKLF